MSNLNEMTEFEKYIRDKFEKEEFDSEDEEDQFLELLNGPFHYQNDPEMLKYAKKHPDATMLELCKHWEKITPPGLAPGDDGKDLLD